MCDPVVVPSIIPRPALRLASKTFFDDNKGCCILLGWVNKSSSESAEIAKHWSFVQVFPWLVWLDGENNERILQWLIEEIETLYKEKNTLESLHLDSGLVVKVKTTNGAQVDHSIVETFAQGGKVCVTSCVYPTKAINEEAQLYVFNSRSVPIQLKQLTEWETETIEIGPF